MFNPSMPPPPMQPPRRSHRLRNWLIGTGVVIVVVIGGLVGCAAIVSSAANKAANPNSATAAGQPHASASAAASSAPPSGPVELAMGGSAQITQDGSPAAVIVVGQPDVSTQAVDEFSEAPQNGYFVSVHITVNATASLTSGFDINPLDFYALSSSTHYNEGDGNAFEGPNGSSELEATTLAAGESASGWLLFDLPSPHGEIAYAPNLNSQPLAEWSF